MGKSARRATLAHTPRKHSAPAHPQSEFCLSETKQSICDTAVNKLSGPQAQTREAPTNATWHLIGILSRATADQLSNEPQQLFQASQDHTSEDSQRRCHGAYSFIQYRIATACRKTHRDAVVRASDWELPNACKHLVVTDVSIYLLLSVCNA